MKKIIAILLMSCSLFYNCSFEPVGEETPPSTTPPGTTIVVPVLTTTAITDVKATSSTSGGTITSDGGAPVTDRGVVWDVKASPTIANSKASSGVGIGNFISSITSLTANTTYYVKAYATNSVGTGYGNQIVFTTSSVTDPTTPSVAPTIITSNISNITVSSAYAVGLISSDGGSSIIDRGIVWSTSANPTTVNSKISKGTGIGSFNTTITPLLQNTKYFVRAYATTNTATYYGNQVEFTTATTPSSGSGYAMTAKVNGVLWQMNNPFNSNAATNPLFDYYPKSDFIQLVGRRGGLLGVDEIQLQIKRTDLIVGSYPISAETFDASKTQIVMIYNSFGKKQNVIEGTLTITEVNTVSKTVKGTFSFKCADEIAPISTLNPVTNTITEGTFNYTY